MFAPPTGQFQALKEQLQVSEHEQAVELSAIRTRQARALGGMTDHETALSEQLRSIDIAPDPEEYPGYPSTAPEALESF